MQCLLKVCFPAAKLFFFLTVQKEKDYSPLIDKESTAKTKNWFVFLMAVNKPHPTPPQT